MLLWSSSRYSSFHRLLPPVQNELGFALSSGSTMDRRGPPTRKCRGVNAKRSVASSDVGDSGLEFRQASILARRVDSSSKVYFRVAVDL